eukprot:13702804-Alexandrium_andersonii.AAC.1
MGMGLPVAETLTTSEGREGEGGGLRAKMGEKAGARGSSLEQVPKLLDVCRCACQGQRRRLSEKGAAGSLCPE